MSGGLESSCASDCDVEGASQMSECSQHGNIQILVTPSRAGTEIKVSSGPASGSTNRKLPSIYNSQETQWIARHRRRRRQRQSVKIDSSGRKTASSPITKYEVNSSRTQSSANSMPQITDEAVQQYLRSHPEWLEKYVMEEVELEQMERWIIRKSQRPRKVKDGRKISLSKWKFCVHADKRKMLQDLTYSLQHRPTKNQVLWELASCISSAVDADGFRLYLPDRDELYLWTDPAVHHSYNDNSKQTTSCHIVNHVWTTKETVRICKGDEDSRFPPDVISEENVHHILCQPVMESNGEFVAVLELCRHKRGGAFHEEDEEIALSYLVWGSIALHYAQLYLNMDKQRRLNDFLLNVVKSVFQDMVSMDTLMVKIMNFAQELVDADRASLFLVDTRSNELYATIFDVRLKKDEDNGEEDSSKDAAKRPSEIRFPLGTGIAGQVAMTGEVLNISDAYSDARFNRNIDQLTGYKTNTILCMPIFKGKGGIIGVVQMINKRLGNFTKEDEDAFQMFAVYCGLALHHAKLYDKIKRSEQKYRVALEVLSYHNTCTDEEFKKALKDGIPEQLIGVDDYYFNPFELKDYEKARHAMYMFIDLFGLTRFERNSLLRFILTVRKNYRRVPYHNWTHGFSVANCMYAIIKHSKNVFRPNECLALYIGALCHDLDHRGKNNKFMLDTESPLANIYSTSTMEHHHFNQTVTILQQEGHNIFSKLTNVEYKQVLHLLKHCILATDLAVFFPNKTRVQHLLKDGSFSWINSEHRLLIQAIAMTGSDLSASAKPWDIQVRTVEVIFQEFYDQGDAEKATGRTPIPMMDRNQPEQQPASQVGFLTGICSPCYTLLHQLIPETKSLLEMCEENLAKWKEIDRRIKEENYVYGRSSIKNI